MFKSISLIATILYVQGALSQIILPGKCPKVQLAKNFDLNKASGVWYVYSQYPFQATESLKCNYAKLILKSGNDLTLVSGGLEKSNNEKVANNLTAKYLGNAELAVNYDGANKDLNVSNFKVLGTDYKNYAAVYNCVQLNKTNHAKVATIYTRQRFPFGETETAKDVFIKNHVRLSYLVKTDQYKCPSSV